MNTCLSDGTLERGCGVFDMMFSPGGLDRAPEG